MICQDRLRIHTHIRLYAKSRTEQRSKTHSKKERCFAQTRLEVAELQAEVIRLQHQLQETTAELNVAKSNASGGGGGGGGGGATELVLLDPLRSAAMAVETAQAEEEGDETEVGGVRAATGRALSPLRASGAAGAPTRGLRRPPQQQAAVVWVGRLVVALFVIVRWRAVLRVFGLRMRTATA
eukprot:COSAG06_NODE_17533_length_935_cov_65.465311_1_plen_182_part_00